MILSRNTWNRLFRIDQLILNFCYLNQKQNSHSSRYVIVSIVHIFLKASLTIWANWRTTSFVQAYCANNQPKVYDLTKMWFFMSALGYHFLLRQSKFKSYQAKKEGEPEELTHLTEGSFEDTTIVVSFSNNLNPETKKASIY